MFFRDAVDGVSQDRRRYQVLLTFTPPDPTSIASRSGVISANLKQLRLG